MKLNSIQFLRAVAALLIVYSASINLQKEFSWSYQQDFYHLKNFGFIGADLFFVISGFIISYVAYSFKGTEQALRFATRRFLRINPAYYIASIIYLAVVILEFWIDNTIGIMSINKVINALCDTFLIIPTSGDPSSYSPVINLAWTLSFQWLFYILFFLLILFKARHKTLFITIILTALVLSGYLIQPTDYRIIFFTNPIMLEFLLGCFIFWIYLRLNTMPKYIPISFIVIGVVSYIILIANSFKDVSQKDDILNAKLSMLRFLIWGIPSALLVAGFLFMEKINMANRLYSNKWVQLIGDASFAIFLMHSIVFFLLKILYKKTGLPVNPDLAIFLQLIIAVAVSIGFYKLIEKRLLGALQKISIKKTTQTSITRPVSGSTPIY